MLQFNNSWYRQVLPLFFMITMLNICFSTAQAQQKYHITGQLGKDQKGLIRLRYFNNGKSYTDSTYVVAGKFELQGYINEPVQADLMLNPLYGRISEEQYYGQDMREVYIEPGETVIRSDRGVKQAKISGKSQSEFERLDGPRKVLDSTGRAMNKEVQKYIDAKNDSALTAMSKKMKDLRAYVARQDSIFIATHPHSQVALNAFFIKMMTEPIDLSVFTPIYKGFDDQRRNSFFGKMLEDRYKLAKALDVGQPATGFTKPDTSGQPFSLASKRGNSVLLFFWARTNPIINKIMSDIHAHFPSLEIVGVSYDFSYENWLSNLHRSNMTWANVIDLGGVNDQMHPVSDLAKAYDISPIRLPQCYLLDKDGIIIARALKVNDLLEEKIKTSLNKN